MSKIKVFVDGHVFDSNPQGTSAYIHGLYGDILKGTDGFEFYLGVGTDKVFDYHPELKGNCNVIKYFFKSNVLRLLFEIPFLFLIHRFHFAHFQYLRPVFRFNVKIITTMHDVLFLRFRDDYPFLYRMLRSIAFKWSARNCQILLTVSDYSRREISHFFDIPESRIFVIPNGVASDTLDKGESRDFIKHKYNVSNFILNVSRFEPRKNQLAIVREYVNGGYSAKGFELVFIGSKTLLYPDFFGYINNIDSSIRQKIHFFEKISKNDLDRFYSAAEIFVYPSFSEGFGIPPIEAAIQKTPVVCSKTTAMADFDFFGSNLVDPENGSELSISIKNNLLKQAYDTETVKCLVLNKYSWKRSQIMLLQLMRQM